MLNQKEAKALVEKENPGVKAIDCFKYKSIFLVRVEHPSEDEADWDPFYSVSPQTGVVKEFSIITDGDPAEIAKAFENRDESYD